MRIHSKSLIAALVTFALCATCGAYLTELNHKLYQKDQDKLLQEIVASQASALERRLSHSLSATYILAQEIKRSQGKFPDFERYAEQVMQSIGGISNLQLAPNGIIDRIHPLQGNERAIGHNLLRDDARKVEAQMAIREKRLTLAGPFTLIQGGEAVIGRLPVFLEQQGQEAFWGFVSVLIYLDDLLHTTQLDALTQRGYTYQLSRIHPDTESLEIFAGSDQLDETHIQSHPIRVPNNRWFLAISLPAQYNHLVGGILTLVLSLMLAAGVYCLARLPEHLRRKVDQQTKQLRELAYQDHLTGLANRRMLQNQLQYEILDLERNKHLAALLCIDLDDFKRINDTMGHDAGDILLQKTAARFRDALRKNDIVARLGGDEFAILLVDIGDFDNARKIAMNLVESMRKPMMIHEQEITVSTSVGIALVPNDGKDANTLMRHADLALYAAKKEGKNGFQFYDQDMQHQATLNLEIERDLRLALEQDQLRLHYQPIVSLHQRHIIGYEALIRWQHPEKGLIFPDQFIPAAEVSHQIIPLGYWVIRKACEMIVERARQDLEPVQIAVNLSPQQLNDPGLSEAVLEILAETGAAAHLLDFEITETALMQNMTLAVGTLDHLRATRIQTSIDDFGTGYSSLSQLKSLPLDTLKIDRSFVDGLGEDGHDRQIVEAIIAMAKKLNLKVVAEGIETPEQLAFLMENRADYGQGYLFSRPVPEDQMMQLPLNLQDAWPLKRETAEA